MNRCNPERSDTRRSFLRTLAASALLVATGTFGLKAQAKEETRAFPAFDPKKHVIRTGKELEQFFRVGNQTKEYFTRGDGRTFWILRDFDGVTYGERTQ